MAAIKRPTLADKLGAWQMAYDAIREHVIGAYAIVWDGKKLVQMAPEIEAAIMATAASLVGGIQW